MTYPVVTREAVTPRKRAPDEGLGQHLAAWNSATLTSRFPSGG